jgi:hypothetical protein
MSKLLRCVAAGWDAKKLGGSCFSTILVFILLVRGPPAWDDGQPWQVHVEAPGGGRDGCGPGWRVGCGTVGAQRELDAMG